MKATSRLIYFCTPHECITCLVFFNQRRAWKAILWKKLSSYAHNLCLVNIWHLFEPRTLILLMVTNIVFVCHRQHFVYISSLVMSAVKLCCCEQICTQCSFLYQDYRYHKCIDHPKMFCELYFVNEMNVLKDFISFWFWSIIAFRHHFWLMTIINT